MRRRFTLARLVVFLSPFFLLISAPVCSASAERIQQEIIYHTAKAKEVFICWAIDDWQVPSQELIPHGSYVKEGMVYTPMEMSGDSFKVVITVKDGSYLHYMFWLAKDEKGNPSINWDTYYGANYSLLAKKWNEPRVIISIYDSPLINAFNLFSMGEVIAIAGVTTFFISLLFFFRNLKNISSLLLFNGFLLASSVITMMARFQMNGLDDRPYLVFGASYHDLLFLVLFGAVGSWVLVLLKKRHTRNVVATFFLLFLLIITTIAICNIEVVRQIGRPLNYQWFYYSGFLQSTDAKNALAKNFSGQMIKDILLILTGFVTAGTGIALFLSANTSSKRSRWILAAFAIGFLSIGFMQKSDAKLTSQKTGNPIVLFIASWFAADKVPKLFSMDVSPRVRTQITDLHRRSDQNDSLIFPGIKHIILFVLESAPTEYISTYNKQFRVTPFLEKWRPHSRHFENVYAHIPSTPNSLFALVSGVYPLISYRSVLNEKSAFSIQSIATVLKETRRICSMFSAADLSFSQMEDYLYQQKFDTVRDVKHIECTQKGFGSNYADLDGIDDKCLAEDFSMWLKTMREEKTFSILWTMQTHHPYSFNGKETEYIHGNPDLNRYLNALQHGDEAFGFLMEQLEKEGILNQSLVIVTGDHGEAFGRHNQFTHGSHIYEENIHIPLIMINPLLFHGERDVRIAGLIDIPATIAGITGSKIPDEWQGRSLLDSNTKDQAFFFSPYSDFLFGTRHGNWKLIFNASTNSFELYDLANDPRETTNLADDNPEIVNREYEYIAAWVQYQNDKMKVWMSN